ncbi:MAG: acyltransferase, partial [Sarcina sp.]
MKNKISIRESNFELGRIILMFMVITLHYLGHGGVLTNVAIGSFNFYISYFLEGLSIIAVNTFIIMFGYFQSKSSFKLYKVIKFYLMILFYSF